MMPRQRADDKRPRVERMDKPVGHHGTELWWRYTVPLTHGALSGWRATQPEALRACESLIAEKASRGWT